MIFYLLGILGYYKITNRQVPGVICLIFFLVVVIAPTTALYLLLHTHWIFCVIAFAGGLFYWTFIEYFVHRFLLHKWFKNFQSHPGPNTWIMAVLKLTSFVLAVLLIITAVFYSYYLYLPAGIITGFTFFLLMQTIINSRAGKWLLPGLKQFHEKHMQLNGEKCFGITNTAWDTAFNTHFKKPVIDRIKIRRFSFGRMKAKNLFPD